jgi:hypothetical protein
MHCFIPKKVSQCWQTGLIVKEEHTIDDNGRTKRSKCGPDQPGSPELLPFFGVFEVLNFFLHMAHEIGVPLVPVLLS